MVISPEIRGGYLFLKHAGHVALVLALAYALALVIFLLTARQSYHYLGQTAVVDKQSQRHDGIA